MTAAKHTPGPWHWPHDSNELCPVEPNPDRSAVSSILYAYGGFGFLGSATADTLAELDADRRLIAAAPELLAALQVFAERNSSEEFITITVRTAHVERAREAIAKATGDAT